MEILIVVLFLVLGILLISKPVHWGWKRLAQLALLSVFALAAVVLFRDTTSTLTLTALNEKNEKSEATEVWLTSVIANGEKIAPEKLFSGDWVREAGCLKWRSYAPDADLHRTLTAKISGGESIQLFFDSCKWRGRVRIDCGKGSTVLDTYDANDQPGTKTLSFDVSAPAEVKQFNSRQALFLGIAGLTLAAVFFMLLDAWKGKKKGLPVFNSEECTVGNREIWLDILKVVSGFFIVMIHSVGAGYQKTFGTDAWTGFLILNVLPRFAVPVFMMESGVLMLGKEIPLEKALRKAGKAVILLVFWNVFYMSLRQVMLENSESLWHQIAAIPVKRQFSGHLWYIYFLVWMYLFAPVLSTLYRAMTKTARIYFVCITLLVPGVLDFYNSWFSLGGQTALESFQLYMVPSYAGLMVLGRLLYEEVSNIRYAHLVGLGVTALGFGNALFLTFSYCKAHNRAAEPFIYENKLFAVLFAAGVFLLFASQAEKMKCLPEPVKCFVVYLSKRALGIYFFHQVAIWALPNFEFAGITIDCTHNAFEALLCITLYYVISAYCVAAMSKIPILKKLTM